MKTEQEFNYPNKNEIMALILNMKFNPFDDSDYWAWSGVEGKNPLIAYNDEYTIVIDDNIINVLAHEDPYGGQVYSLIEGL